MGKFPNNIVYLSGGLTITVYEVLHLPGHFKGNISHFPVNFWMTQEIIKTVIYGQR